MMPKMAHLCILLLLAFISGVFADMLYVGASIDLGAIATRESRLVLQGYRLWEKWANDRGGVNIGGTNYTVSLVIRDDGGDPNRLRANYELFCTGIVNITLSPFGSANTMIASNVTNSCGMFMISSAASSPAVFNRGFEYLFTPVVTLERFFPDIVAMLSAKNWKRYALIYSTDPFCQGAVFYFQSALNQAGGIVTFNQLYDNFVDLFVGAEALRSTNYDVLFTCGFLNEFSLFVKAVKFLKFDPKAIIWGEQLALEEKTRYDANYWIATAQWVPTMTSGVSNKYLGTNAEFIQHFQAMYNSTPGIWEAHGAGGGALLHLALETAGSMSPNAIRSGLLNLPQGTEIFLGELRFDLKGLNPAKPMIITQVLNGDIVAVYPPEFATANAQLGSKWPWIVIYKPTDPIVISSIVISALGLAFVVSVWGALIYWRNHKVIRSGSLLFCHGICFGGTLIILSNLLNVVDIEQDPSMCFGPALLLALGFVVLFGCLAVKTYRLSRIFGQQSIKVVTIKDKHLILVVSILGMVQIGLVLLMSLLQFDSSIGITSLIEKRETDIGEYVYLCKTDVSGLSVLLVLNGGLIIFLATVAWRVRKIKNVLFNESNYILGTVWNLFFVSVVVAPLTLSLREAPSSAMLLRMLASNFVAVMAVAANLLPKMYIVKVATEDQLRYLYSTGRLTMPKNYESKTTTKQGLNVGTNSLKDDTSSVNNGAGASNLTKSPSNSKKDNASTNKQPKPMQVEQGGDPLEEGLRVSQFAGPPESSERTLLDSKGLVKSPSSINGDDASNQA